MRTKTARAVWMLVLGNAMAGSAVAHQPQLSDGSAVDPEQAIPLPDAQISRVIYHEVTPDAPRMWLTFEVDGPQELFLQLGMPVIERLADYRPAVALLGTGLDPIELPFDTPEGLGGILLSSAEVEEPRVFDEPFSGTSSWILREEDIELPEAGRYYVVAFDPAGQPGKLWVAVGREEVFELDDILELTGILPQVQAFHETQGGGVPCLLFPVAGVLSMLLVGRLSGGLGVRPRASRTRP